MLCLMLRSLLRHNTRAVAYSLGRTVQWVTYLTVTNI